MTTIHDDSAATWRDLTDQLTPQQTAHLDSVERRFVDSGIGEHPEFADESADDTEVVGEGARPLAGWFATQSRPFAQPTTASQAVVGWVAFGGRRTPDNEAPRPRDTFTADSMVYYPPMISLSVCKPMCIAALLAGVVACAPNHQAAEVGDTTAGGGAATATTGHPAEQLTAQAAAEKIKAAIPEVSLITITGDNDANNMIGRSTGYVAATVIVDPRTGEECDQAKPGIVCGAGIEQWPDAKAAQQRADYLKGVMNAMPILGTEYAPLRGNLLLRVDGKLSPSVADQYKTAFTN